MGVHIVLEGANRPPAELGSTAWALGEEVLIERYIPGRELTVARFSAGSALRSSVLRVRSLPTRAARLEGPEVAPAYRTGRGEMRLLLVYLVGAPEECGVK